MSRKLALDEALSQLSAALPPPPKKVTKIPTEKASPHPAPKETSPSSRSPYAYTSLKPQDTPQQYYEQSLPPDNLILASEQRVTIHALRQRFLTLCSRVLPFGTVGELELQVLALTSNGYSQEGPDIWLQKSRLARQFAHRWYQKLRQVYSEPHRALHTFTKVALLLSYLDIFSSPLFDEESSQATNKQKKHKRKQKQSPREQARTAAEVIGSAHVSRKDALELAIWFQDSVCNPGEGDVISKRESASWFESFARDGGLPDNDRCKISRIIRHTAIFSSENTSENTSKQTESKSKSKSTSFTMDAAMLRSFNRIFLFGGLRSVHCDRSHCLRLEYRHLPTMKWCKRRAGMLREYLSLKRFLEPSGGSAWMKSGELRDQVEREIRRNLEFEIDALRSGELPGSEKIMMAAGGPVLPLLDLPRYLDGGSSQVYVTPLVDSSASRGSSMGSITSSVSHCVVVPGGRTARQSRSTPVVYYVLGGAGEVFRGGCSDRIRKNDTVRICKHIPHYFVNRQQEQELYLLIIGGSQGAVVLE